ncbi:hypothetical protein [Alteromonas facilis]|uniref:hypothetical protein n=1 Tax=Alteromonas facilis TaxID=2048004 RepID=UPI000F5CAF39|nr:hypothetical protein [Alteromonas facilis]
MKLVFTFLLLLLTGCVATPRIGTETTSMELLTTHAAPNTKQTEAEYQLDIKASGKQGEFVYLNTKLDYRDQENITVTIPPSVVSLLESTYGQPAEDFFIGKAIAVRGLARQVRTQASTEGQSNAKFFYQTHIRIKDIAQIVVLGMSQ